MDGAAKQAKQQALDAEEGKVAALEDKLKNAKEAYEPLKEQWDNAETQRMTDEAKEYKEQKD